MRSELTMAERIQICRHHEGGRITNKALSLWASEKMGKPISEMMISRILIRKIELLGSDVGSNRKHYRKPECPNLESISYSWFLTMQEANVTISDAMLIAKAKMLSNSVPRERKNLGKGKEFDREIGRRGEKSSVVGLFEWSGGETECRRFDVAKGCMVGSVAAVWLAEGAGSTVFHVRRCEQTFRLYPTSLVETSVTVVKKGRRRKEGLSTSCRVSSSIRSPGCVEEIDVNMNEERRMEVGRLGDVDSTLYLHHRSV
ncbi:hypothetical protein R1flu_014915 [Riccia fluitans]|uniref:Uncharacterized protein n=1 Tax=Riccia fluitans TaxID=41844 RepID=A0ABD1YHF6_9MARC